MKPYAFLTPTKYLVREVQLRLFELGYEWSYSGKDLKTPQICEGIITNWDNDGGISFSSTEDFIKEKIESGEILEGSLDDLFNTLKFNLNPDKLEIL